MITWHKPFRNVEDTVDLVAESLNVDAANLCTTKEQCIAMKHPDGAWKTLAEIEQEVIAHRIHAIGNMSRVAPSLGVSRSTLYRKTRSPA